MIYLGIDPSLSGTSIVGVSSVNALLFHATIDTTVPAKKRAERLSDLQQKFLAVLYHHIDMRATDDLTVALEGYSFGSTGKKETLAEWGGVLRLSLYDLGIKYTEIPPKSMKKFITNNGNANKVLIATSIQRIYGVEFGGNDNEYDAYGLAQVARGIGGGAEVFEDQKEVLLNCVKGE